MMGDEILPCPFCGKPPEVYPSGENDKGTMIECITPDCVNPNTSYYGDGAAARVWNTRPTAATVSGELADLAHMKSALKETLKRYPNSEDALVFYSAASGLAMENPTEADKAWASTVVAALSPPTEGR